MSVRVFVASAALMIFGWLAGTFFRDVPMETYPAAPLVAAPLPAEDHPPVLATSLDELGEGLLSEAVTTQ